MVVLTMRLLIVDARSSKGATLTLLEIVRTSISSGVGFGVID